MYDLFFVSMIYNNNTCVGESWSPSVLSVLFPSIQYVIDRREIIVWHDKNENDLYFYLGRRREKKTPPTLNWWNDSEINKRAINYYYLSENPPIMPKMMDSLHVKHQTAFIYLCVVVFSHTTNNRRKKTEINSLKMECKCQTQNNR